MFFESNNIQVLLDISANTTLRVFRVDAALLVFLPHCRTPSILHCVISPYSRLAAGMVKMQMILIGHAPLFDCYVINSALQLDSHLSLYHKVKSLHKNIEESVSIKTP